MDGPRRVGRARPITFKIGRLKAKDDCPGDLRAVWLHSTLTDEYTYTLAFSGGRKPTTKSRRL